MSFCLVRKPRGFTLIEILVVMVVLAILSALATPTYRRFLINQQLSSASSDFLSSMLQARSEALRLGKPVSVLPTNGSTWDGGWYLVVVNSSCAITGSAFAIREPLESMVTIKATTDKSFAASSPSFTYAPSGFPVTSCPSPYYSGAMNGTLVFYASETGREKQVIVSKPGRARICDPSRETCVSD